MSPQIEFLKNLIDTARRGDPEVVKLLRDVCRAAVDEAPPHDLVTLAECLVHVGEEATRTETRRN